MRGAYPHAVLPCSLHLLPQMYAATRRMPAFFSENQGMQTLVNVAVSASMVKLSK